MSPDMQIPFAGRIDSLPASSRGPALFQRWSSRQIAWFSKIGFLVRKSFSARHSRSSIGAVISLVEPFVYIFTLTSVRWTLAGVADWNEAVFFATGVVPYFYFFHLSVKVRLAGAARVIPGVSLFDRVCAVIFAETLSNILAMILMMSVFYYMGGWRAVPNNIAGCFLPYACFTMCGVGIGLFNVAVGRIVPTYTYIFAFFTRVLLLGSGIVLRPEVIPPRVRWVIEYNPFFHCVGWFRVNWLKNYPDYLLDKNYALFFAAGSVLVGSIVYKQIGRGD